MVLQSPLVVDRLSKLPSKGLIPRFFEKEEYRRYSQHGHRPDSIDDILLLCAQKHAVHKINV